MPPSYEDAGRNGPRGRYGARDVPVRVDGPRLLALANVDVLHDRVGAGALEPQPVPSGIS